MAAMFGQAFALYGDAAEAELPVFIPITDGSQVEILITDAGVSDGWAPPAGKNILDLFQDRIEGVIEQNPDGPAPEQMLRALGYNMPVMLFAGDEFDTFDEARQAAQTLVDQTNTAYGATT